MVVLPMQVEYYYVLLLTGDIMGVKQTILSISMVDKLFHGGFTIMSRAPFSYYLHRSVEICAATCMD